LYLRHTRMPAAVHPPLVRTIGFWASALVIIAFGVVYIATLR
jgi:hypothetical protein